MTAPIRLGQPHRPGPLGSPTAGRNPVLPAAARREELGYSQRKLSDDKIISQSNLVAFERGRSWPREGTREKLERYLKWPPATLARIRHGAAVPQGDADGESTEALSDTMQVSMLVEAVELALDGIKARAATLAAPDDPGFNRRFANCWPNYAGCRPPPLTPRAVPRDPVWHCCFRRAPHLQRAHAARRARPAPRWVRACMRPAVGPS